MRKSLFTEEQIIGILKEADAGAQIVEICLTIMDEFSRECLAIHVAHSIPAVRVIEVLERLRGKRGLPEIIMTDNGSEFTSRAFDAWAYSRGVRIDYIQPGKPVQNCFIESLKRDPSGRVPQPSLVPLPARSEAGDRDLESGLQSGAAG